ncbi:hypothetical protein K32_31720 [Kaistia sp. 32K]|uniref:Stf0 family sulfotransferase n=1 Tax=Kaistia sp. 32K TaxID=2795690 RepID=UPI00191616B4|nr:Stf0 family sulfotransferase [Kaistia sp. 32K]BCP54555.1 hypothetical protein K32_31720 [Kaistia sp. 32K]
MKLRFWRRRAHSRPALRLHPPPDWIAPRATIAIVGAQRSGTSLLCSLMAATGQLGRPGEFFNSGAKMFINRHGADTTLHRLNVARAHMSPNGVFSLKLFPGHLDSAARDVYLWEFFPNPVFVRVFRDDLLGQAISLARAWQTEKWNSRITGPSVEPSYSRLEIDRALADITNENARWDRYFARNRIVPMKVRYEDLQREPASILRDIAKLVGVTLAKPPGIEDSDLQIQRDHRTEQWRSTFLAEAGSLERIY